MLNFIVGLYALLVFQIAYSADIKHWFGGFLALTVPVAIVLNVFFLLSYLFSGSWKFFVSLLVLVTGYPLLERTIKFNLTNNSTFEGSKLSVLSYNTMYCAYGNAYSKEVTQGLVNDLDTLSADIKCIQEFYNRPGHAYLNTLERLKRNNPYYTYMHSEIDEKSHIGAVGLATFSKYPIIYKEEISWKTNNNGLLLTDIVVNSDTVRVINMQLKSMGIRVKKAISSDENVRKKEAKTILSQLKSGFIDRAIQVDKLEDLIEASPYPVLISGDFNELPYGYAYGRIRKHLGNAFEEKGFGFGFTYHKILSFLRIDNLFFDQNVFQVLSFKRYKNLSYSDHYPILAEYGFK